MGIEEIKKRRIVAVIRHAKPDTIIPIAHALYAGGVSALEITMETPRAIQVIEALRSEFTNEVLVGPELFWMAKQQERPVMSGAQFVFSPTVNKETIQMTKRYGVISVPGAMTPTEILTAYEAGADLIKVFPAHVLGPAYFKAVAGPIPHIPLMPTGGIDVDNIVDYFKAGAVAAGVGSTLVDASREISDENLLRLTNKACLFIDKVQGLER
ncbi:bifunctional 4-hydroxy-2-oxoglutarate aldolase/2-dehydro-3-deoxy-phosphogluconate aldolase [Neobacillus sp. PS3-34]|uniref:bifunctional 4-hydroxy-2-oxoglutarate aldolase/2-dehydro-3-deoxy-phosphogluconate aldolase n=1 Tax=Neobacillus sp. PS3-34 TaxID=3070678 RepID=UPI0027DF8CAE|nr:bifunctional 4-hydroxy-2-oxoglutarate aldolase/2-dehydro-3-deoxy-phosphogluconate aldolase [Neobacillus sp. PS3-34]WML49186.1 bifunctional 4-hydroxy-2-oxoglutarate aldolase/2-dehydro-3-deoxy-phosphogluconate aldolase [Neobacillus sp. PS3-34]